MKHMKRMASLVLALAMALTLAVPAMAANDTAHKITIKNETSGHTYEAYQVFAGNLTGDDLDVIIWGSGVNGEALLAALKTQDAYKNCKNAADVATVLDGFGDNSEDLDAFAKIVANHLTAVKATSTVVASSDTQTTYEITVAGDGYYFVKDQKDTVPAGDAYTKYILKVVKDVEVEAKDGTVTFEKKVIDTNDSTGATSDWQDSADYDIGDEISFQLRGTLPENYEDYTEYYFAFHDKEGTGLTFKYDNTNLDASVTVKVGDTPISDDYYDVIIPQGEGSDGCTFHVVFPNLKQISGLTGGSVITVDYTSTLNDEAVIGAAGNPNEAQLEYSNNPNTEGHGKTPWDKVIVFTYKVIANKVNEKNEKLPGAGFTLYKKNAAGVYEQVGEEFVGGAETTFTWEGVDDGDYKLVETTTPPGYNTMEDIVFTISATHDTNSQDPQLIALDGGVLGTGAVDTGAITEDIVNRSGAELPSTGGMGTTLFYALGAVLVIGAGVAMVTKKRMA